jgi:hypothetical protein
MIFLKRKKVTENKKEWHTTSLPLSTVQHHVYGDFKVSFFSIRKSDITITNLIGDKDGICKAAKAKAQRVVCIKSPLISLGKEVKADEYPGS